MSTNITANGPPSPMLSCLSLPGGIFYPWKLEGPAGRTAQSDHANINTERVGKQVPQLLHSQREHSVCPVGLNLVAHSGLLTNAFFQALLTFFLPHFTALLDHIVPQDQSQISYLHPNSLF